MDKLKKFPWVEIIPVAIISILFYSLLHKYVVPRTYHSDVIWYLDAAYNNLDNFIIWVNRYSHIYLLKFFFLYSSDPFEIGKNYWVFMFSTSALLVYLNARILTSRSNFIHGFLAVCFFISINIFSSSIGIPLVDYTSMLLTLLVVFVYLVSLKKSPKTTGLLILLGFLFFIAFKTKETAWVSAILILGLGFDNENKFSFSLLKKTLIPLLYGAGFGVTLFMVLDGLFMKDIFYGLRPEHLFSSANYFASAEPHIKNHENWYNLFIFQNIPYLFSFSLISLGSQKKYIWPLANRLVWAIPFLLILVLSIPQLTANYPVFQHRFFFPGLAILSITAPQFIGFELPKIKKEKTIFWASLIVGAFTLKSVWTGTLIFSNMHDFDHPQLINGFYRPLIFTSIILLFIFFYKLRTSLVFIPIFLTLGFLIQPIKKNYQTLSIHEEIYTVQPRFSPLIEFEEFIEYSPDMLIYISPSFSSADYYLSENIDTVSAAFDLIFHVSSDRKNFTYTPENKSLAKKIIEKKFDYLFLLNEDWGGIKDEKILEVCDFYEDNEEKIVFLDCN